MNRKGGRISRPDLERFSEDPTSAEITGLGNRDKFEVAIVYGRELLSTTAT